MKTKISRIGKKSLSIVIALIMIVSTMLVGMVSVNAASETFVAKSKIYIDIGSTWYSSVTDTNVNATIYAKYCYSDGNSDINNPVSTEKLTQVSESIYTGTIPDNAFIRCIKVERRNSDGTTTWNSFNALGSKRSDDGNNLATFTNTGADWSVGTVTWSTYSGGSTSHSISKGAETNGTFSVSATSATAGSTVTVTTFPATGYEVDKVTYTANGSTQDASGSNNTYTFKMPAANVTVNVTFKQSTTPSATYYLTGRFGIKNDDGTMTYLAGSLNGWVDGITSNIKFTQVPGSTLYKLETGLTIKDLATNTGDSTWYFQISDGTNKYRPDSGADKAITIDDKNSNFGTGTSGGSFYFTGNDETGNVTLYFDTNGNKFYFEVGGSTPTTEDGAFTIEDKSEGHGTLSFTSSGENRTPGTANAGETVTVTAKPEASYFSCDSVAVTYETTSKEKVTITSSAIQNNSCTFVVPADLTAASVKDAEISVKATFTLDKPAYIQSLGNGLWIDVDPDHNDTTATLIKWNNYKGSNHSTTSNYTFYVSKNVDLTNAKVYNGFDSDVTLNGVNIPANNCNTSQLNLSNTSTTYTTSGATSASVKVMQGSTDSMFLYTTKSGTAYNLPTQIGAGAKKGDVKTDGGVCKTISNTGSYSKVMNLESVKGRGNSSWQASHEVFGKYAYNMKLSSKTNLLGMDSAESKGAKSWCLLANNADESMLRNALTYQLADEIGLLYSPEFRFVDIYDNGEYMGSYLVTEKVDVGSSKLVKGESFEDLNEDGAMDDGGKVDEATVEATYNFNGKNYAMKYAKVSPNGDTSDASKYPYETDGKYLLEFEINERYTDEASWFTSPQGQNVVVKTPEFATKEQVTFIAQKFAAMEALISSDYSKNGTSTATKEQLSTVMDVESFAKMYLIQEFSSNLDSASTSYYITYDCAQSNPVFVANPVWDYDWAYGQYHNITEKKDVNGNLLTFDNPENYWVAKYKSYDDSKNGSKYSIQSMLAGTNSDFKSVIRKVWEQPGGFFETIQTYCGSNSKIDSWYDDIKDSVAMNEYRWGFIANDPISSWGSTDNGDTHLDAVNYLENTWVAQRAAWLDTQFTNDTEYAPFTPATPTIKAFKADGKTEIAEEFTGTDFIIKVTSNIESGVKYRLYEGSSSEYLENADGVFTLNVTEAGEKTYTVKAVCGNLESQASAPVTITIITAVDISGVRLTTLKTEVSVNETFTLTAEVAPVGLSGVTYTYYMNNAPINGATDITSNTYQVRIASAGSATFKVAATANGKTVTSSSVTVTATKVDNVHNLKVYFKCPSAPAYKPSVSIDGKAPVAMTQGTELGKNYSGTLTFYWYYADLGEINSADVHTVTFTSKRTKLNATMEDIFADTEYYLAVDDLMSGTEVVDLTEFSGDAEKEHILNFYHSATNTVYSGVGTDKTLGFTNIGGTRYKMGTLVDNNGVATFSIRSATAMQMLSAQLTTVSKTQQALLDVNLDGRVDVKDATLMQRALVS